MVSDFFYPNTGGVENHIYQLAQCLMMRGHKVTVLTHAYDDIHTGILHLTNALKVYYAPRLPFYQSTTLPTFFGSFSLFRSIVIREQIDLLHVHQAFSTMAHESVMHARTMDMKVVFTDHSLFGFADASSILMNKVLKFTLADIHAAICVSHTSKENTVLRACIPPDRVAVIPNAVDASQFAPDPSKRRNDGGVTIVCLSRLVYRKGIDLLAAALPVLCRRHSNVNVLIGGDGPKRALLEQTVEEEGLQGQVTLLGALPHDKVRDLLIQGHIFLNCSLTEAFCMALVEAAAAGLLVVSTAVGGVPEVLPPNMMVMAEPSPDGILLAVDIALEKVKIVEPWNFHKAAQKMYNWHSVARRTELVYTNVLHGGEGREEQGEEGGRGEGRDDSMTGRLKRYYKCGVWFGKICCCVVAVDWLYWKYLEWKVPGDSIETVPNVPLTLYTSGKQRRRSGGRNKMD